MNIPNENQRLIYKGRQLKDDKLLSDYSNTSLILVHNDEEIIHLVTRIPEISGTQSSTSQENTQQQQPNINLGNLGGMFGGLLNNPNAMIQISSLVLDDLGRPSSQGQTNPINNILQNLLNPQQRTLQTNTTDQSNVETTNVNNNTNTQPTNNVTNNTQTNSNADIFDQYPILRPVNQHINNLGNIVNEITGGNNNNIPILPCHSYPRNILVAIAIILKNWTNQISRFVPYVTTLAEGLERESILTNTEERNKLHELARKVNAGLNEISQACNTLQQTMSGLNVGTGPGLGFTTLLHTTMNAVSIISPNTDNTQQINQTNTSTSQIQQQTDQQSRPTTEPQTNNQPRNNPLNQVLNQLNQPGGLQNMMSMVGTLLNNPNGGGDMMNMINSLMGGGSNNPNANNQINSLLNSLLNEPDSQMEDSEQTKEIKLEDIVI
jgi:hypothetical protein